MDSEQWVREGMESREGDRCSEDGPLPAGAPARRAPLQFGIKSLLAMAVAVALLFGTLRWLNVPPLASAMVLVILVVSVGAALGLVVAIAGARDQAE